MLMTITNTRTPATDLGYLLHKNPDRVQSFDLSFGKAHVFYPEATPERCTAALLLDVDPVALVRTRRGPSGEGGALDQYVNDRPYVASSFLSVAIARVLASALGGSSKGRPELVDKPLPLVARITVLPCRGGEDILKRLFEPLGYTVRAEHHIHEMKITILELSLVVLIGPSGCGKSTFGRTHFKPTEVLSSDFCRGLVADSENDQTVTGDAFEILHFIARKRLALGRLGAA